MEDLDGRRLLPQRDRRETRYSRSGQRT